ncbi:MAG: hypothetical protein Q4F18_06200 [Clostridia bacterium]|nr:hypothetical protein [Clostridia bacterium]
MYKLLLVSDKEEVRTLYEGFSEWENLGFERPAVAADANEGIDLLGKERFDAVSWLLSVSEGKRFFGYLSRRPEMLGMETARDEARLRREISSARRTLSSRDAARQTKQVDDLTRAMQGEFFCDLLRGAAYDSAKIQERMRSLRMMEVRPERPLATASFRLPQGDYFLSEVWRYGRERLENALKNIFESGDPHMHFVLLIINPHHMRLIGLPRQDMSGDEVYDRMVMHLDRCQAALEEYFELTLNIKRVIRYDNLYELGKENALRTAH